MLGERKWECRPRWRWEKLRSIFLRRQRNKNRADTQTDKSMGIDDTWMLVRRKTTWIKIGPMDKKTNKQTRGM
uniref:Uncharacterized protein n=1 Tax=Gossypium raimondii TaxID=29730 RepID=A0A0D2NQR0_GOSRA|nr:hypothetical protein B456_006G117700 [Gossypium raimondii]